MAVSVGDLALDLRLIADATEAVPDGQTAILTRQLGAADALITERTSGAPDALKDAAALAIAAYLYDRPTAGGGTRYASAWRNSGASEILSAYVRRRAVVIGGGAAGASEPLAPGGGLSTAEVNALIAAYAGEHPDRTDADVNALIAAYLAANPPDGADAVARAVAAANAVSLAGKQNVLMPPNDAEADAGTANAIRGWTARLVRRAADAAIAAGEDPTPITATAAFAPRILFATAAVAGNWQELTLAEDLPTEGQLIEFRLAAGGTGAGEYGLCTAEELANTTAANAAPANFNGSLPIKVMDYDDRGFGHDTLLVQKSDEANKIWVRTGRNVATSWTIKSFGITVEVTGEGGGSGILAALADIEQRLSALEAE